MSGIVFASRDRAATADRTGVDPDRYYRGWQSFVGPAGAVARGEKLRGTDPRVTGAPQNFVDADTPEREWPAAGDLIIEANRVREEERKERERIAFEKAARANRRRIEFPVVRAKRDVVCRYDSMPTTITKGSTLSADDPVAQSHSEDFTSL